MLYIGIVIAIAIAAAAAFFFMKKPAPKPEPKPAKPAAIGARINCDVTDWSSWGACSEDRCDRVGERWRYRFVRQKASGGGTPCPTKLSDYESCMTPCEKQG